MQNDKNINTENEFLKLVYGPPAYFNKMTIQELRAEVKTIQSLIFECMTLSNNDMTQLKKYIDIYLNKIETLNKQYSI